MSIRWDIATAVAAAIDAAAQAGELGAESVAASAVRSARADCGDVPPTGPVLIRAAYAAVEETPASRAGTDLEVTVDVAVQQKVGGVAAARVGELEDLTERVAGVLRRRHLTLAGGQQAVWVKAAQPMAYVPEHLEQYHVYTAVLRQTYRVTV
jgi:hypothetical protein